MRREGWSSFCRTLSIVLLCQAALAAPLVPWRVMEAAESQRDSICLAVGRGNLQTVSNLLDAGTNPDSADSKGMTPLLYAAFRGDQEIRDIDRMITRCLGVR